MAFSSNIVVGFEAERKKKRRNGIGIGIGMAVAEWKVAMVKTIKNMVDGWANGIDDDGLRRNEGNGAKIVVVDGRRDIFMLNLLNE